MTPIDDHFKRALAYVRPYVGSLVPVVVVSLLSTGLSLVLPFLSKVSQSSGPSNLHKISGHGRGSFVGTFDRIDHAIDLRRAFFCRDTQGDHSKSHQA